MQVEIRQIVFPLGQPSLCCQSKPLCSSSLVCGHTVAEKGHSPKRVRSARITLFRGLQKPVGGCFEITLRARPKEIASPKVVLGICIALFGGLFEPLECFLVVLGYPLSRTVHCPQF